MVGWKRLMRSQAIVLVELSSIDSVNHKKSVNTYHVLKTYAGKAKLDTLIFTESTKRSIKTNVGDQYVLFLGKLKDRYHINYSNKYGSFKLSSQFCKTSDGVKVIQWLKYNWLLQGVPETVLSHQATCKNNKFTEILNSEKLMSFSKFEKYFDNLKFKE